MYPPGGLFHRPSSWYPNSVGRLEENGHEIGLMVIGDEFLLIFATFSSRTEILDKSLGNEAMFFAMHVI